MVMHDESEREGAEIPRRRLSRPLLRSLFEDYLLPEGRMNRKLYAYRFLAFLLAFLFFFALLASTMYLFFQEAAAGSLIGEQDFLAGILAFILFYLPVFFLFCSFLSATVRRWHDIGFDDRALVWRVFYPFLGGTFFLFFLLAFHEMGFVPLPSFISPESAELLPMIFMFLFPLAVLLYLLFTRGEAQENAFGTRESARRLRPVIREKQRNDLSWRQGYTGTQGRLSRKPYIFRLFIVNFIFYVVSFLVLHTPLVNYVPPQWGLQDVTGILSLLAIAISCPLFIRRLHDVNLPARMVLIPWAIAILLASASFLPENIANSILHFMPQFPLVLLIVGAWNGVYLAFLWVYLIYVKGTEGANAYGENPLVPVEDGHR